MRSVGPGRERSIRVLVAEAADPPVPLSSVLESAGHRVVGRASTPEEVEGLLRVTRPSVVVFDAEMSVEAVAAARESYPRIGIVAVWPAGIASEKVDRVVAPAAAHEALARAVRDASPVTLRRHAAPAAAAVAAASPASIPPRRGRGGVELGVAAVLTFLLVMAAVALRIGEGIPSLVTGAPLVDGPVVPAVTTGSPVPPPDGPSGSTDGSSEGLAELRSTSSSTGGSEGSGPGPTDPQGGDNGPNQGPGGNTPTPPQPPGGSTMTARERACRTAAGLPIEGQIGGPALDGELGHLFDHCLATRSPGPIRALEKFVNGGGGGSGSDGDHGGGQGGGGDGDHGDDDDGDHGHDGDHDDDDDDDGDHGSGHDSDHDDDDDDGGDDSDHDSDHDEHDSDDHDDDDQGEDDDDQGQDDDDQGDDD